MAAEKSFLQALDAKLRVIGALLMWEVITRYGRDNLGFIWLFLEPMIFTLAVTALWSATGLAHSVNLPIVAFALTGYSSVLLWRNCASRCCLAVQANVGLLYHRPVRVLDLLLAKILLEIAGATLSLLALSLLWISIGWMELPRDIVTIAGAWLMLCWFGAALALLVGSLTSFNEIAERFWHPISYIMFPLSGAVFMVDWLSQDARQLILLLPMVHCVELMREGFFGSAIRTHHDMTYVAAVCLVMTALGLALAHEAGRRVKFA